MTLSQVRTAVRSRSSTMRSVAALVTGSSLVAAQLTGLIAQFSDKAGTGNNDVSTPAAQKAADLKIAAYTGTPTAPCGQFSDDLSTGLFEADQIDYYADPDSGGHGSIATYAILCLRNDGMETLTVAIGTSDVALTEVSCDGDEASVDDTCAPEAAGEFSPGVQVTSASNDPATQESLDQECDVFSENYAHPTFSDSAIVTLETSPMDFLTMPPSSTSCLYVPIFDRGPVSAVELQQRQTDRASWRFMFLGRSG